MKNNPIFVCVWQREKRVHALARAVCNGSRNGFYTLKCYLYTGSRTPSKVLSFAYTPIFLLQ